MLPEQNRALATIFSVIAFTGEAAAPARCVRAALDSAKLGHRALHTRSADNGNTTAAQKAPGSRITRRQLPRR